MQSGDLENDLNGAVEDTSPSSSSSSKTTAELDTISPLMVEEPQPPECQEFDSEPGWHPAIHNGIVVFQTISSFYYVLTKGWRGCSV